MKDSGPLDLDKLFSPVANNKTIALAVSGGADSLALMVLVSRWKKQLSSPPQFHVYSVDHGLRDEAQDEVKFVLTTARDLGFEARNLVLGAARTPASQAMARRGRYQVICQAMAEDRAEVLLTGHHAHDQGETVLMRLAHGSGISGLAGMRRFASVEGVEIFRPLLDISREKLARVVEEAQIRPVIDPSNCDERYERVRWRKVMPHLGELGLDFRGLNRFSSRMARADRALEHMSRSKFSEVVSNEGFGIFSILNTSLMAEPEEISIRLLSLMLDGASGKAGSGELAQVEALCGALRTDRFRGQTLAGCCVELYEDRLLVFRETGRIEERRIRLKPGEKKLWDRRFLIENTGKNEIFLLCSSGLSRFEAERLLGREVPYPMSAIHGAPLVVDAEEKPLALGEAVFGAGVRVRPYL